VQSFTRSLAGKSPAVARGAFAAKANTIMQIADNPRTVAPSPRPGDQENTSPANPAGYLRKWLNGGGAAFDASAGLRAFLASPLEGKADLFVRARINRWGVISPQPHLPCPAACPPKREARRWNAGHPGGRRVNNIRQCVVFLYDDFLFSNRVMFYICSARILVRYCDVFAG
jgi:hypothetical protein